MYRTRNDSPPRHNKILIPLFPFLLFFLLRHLSYLAPASVSIYPFYRSVCLRLFPLISLHSVSFTLLVSPYLYQSLQLFSPILFSSPFLHFCLPPFSPLILSFFRMLFGYFPLDEYKERESQLISDAYRGFHGSTVKLYSGISFSREHAHDMACRKPFCSVILSGTISPMRFDDRGPSNARSERFRFPRVSGSFRLFRSLRTPRSLFRSFVQRVAFIALVAAERKRGRADRATQNHAGI